MDWHALLAITSGLPIGFQLGMTGTGGALLAVPVLVYVVGVTVQEAAAMSLVVIAVSSLFGAWEYGRAGQVRGKATLAFAWTGILGVWAGAYGHNLISREILLIAFGFLLLLSRWLITRQGQVLVPTEPTRTCAENFPGRCWIKAAGIGLAVGVLNGVFGVGGGFMIVAALVLALGFPTRLAVGTSLSIIAPIALVGIIGHLEYGSLDVRLTGLVLLGSIAGMWLGARFGQRVPPRVVSRVTAAITVSVAVALILLNATKLAGLSR
jgi:uncharacterized membrane protein YfcA